MEILSKSKEDTRAAGARIARSSARAGDVFGLIGELGTGKTEFVRGFVAALCADCEVHSPSFSILNIYETPEMPIYHFDFYRLKKQAELREIGFEEYIYGNGICLIEWADMFPEVLPKGAVMIRFLDTGEGRRAIAWA
jgi:tRNA threonylcarbamoyladenosine biosynthesis protein TsaE